MAKDKKVRQKKADAAASGRLLPPLIMPKKFAGFQQTASWAKRSVYLIARVRPTGETGKNMVASLGTGFIAAKSRMMTAAHVIDNTEVTDPMRKHQPGDSYLLVRRDDDGEFHQAGFELELGKTLYLYPDLDLAVIYLPDSFYVRDANSYFVHPEQRIRVSAANRSIGQDVGVLGYPLQQIGAAGDGNIDISGVMIRADRGIVNMRYQNNGVDFYEFTMAFNSGNSGGPIIDVGTGQVIAMVRGFKLTITDYKQPGLSDAQKTQLGADKVIVPITAVYSYGTSVRSFADALKQHQIDFDS